MKEKFDKITNCLQDIDILIKELDSCEKEKQQIISQFEKLGSNCSQTEIERLKNKMQKNQNRFEVVNEKLKKLN